MPTYSAEWDPGDYRANNETRNRMGFGGVENGGQRYAERSQDLGMDAQHRGAYVSDMGQSNQARGYQTDALDMLHGAAAGTAPSQAAIQANLAGQQAAATNMSLAGSVKGGPGARVAATRAAMAGNAQAGQNIAAQAAAARAGEMAQARGQLVQGATATRQTDLGAAQIQQQNELAQRQMNDAQQRFFENQGATIQATDQANQLAQQGLAQNAWTQGRAATMADEGFGFNKGMTYAKAGAAAAQGGVSAGLAAGGAGGDDDMGSDERMKDVYVPSKRNLTLSPIEAKNVVPFNSAMSPMTGAAPATFDKMTPGGGMDVLGSLKAHSDFATRFQGDPSGGMMMSPREAKIPVSLDTAMQDSFGGKGDPGVAYGYLGDSPGVDPYQSGRGGQYDDATADYAKHFDVDAAVADARQADNRKEAQTIQSHFKGSPAQDRRASILSGVLGGFAGRNAMVSDDKTKLAAAWDEGHKAALGDVAKRGGGEYVGQVQTDRATADQQRANQKQTGKKGDTGLVRAGVEAHRAEERRAASEPSTFPARGRVEYRPQVNLDDAEANAEYAKTLPWYQPPSPAAPEPAPASSAMSNIGGFFKSDEEAKNVVDPKVDFDAAFREADNEPRVRSMEKTFRRDTPADQKRVKRGVEDKAGRDADEIMASFGKSLDKGPSAKRDEGYVPDMAMFAAMKSMEPQLYAYKPEFKPPEQQPGELQAGPMANNMARDPIARMTLVKDPQTGLLAIDKDKALKLTMGSLATLADDVEELKRKKGGHK